jgi:hypothetical protein
MTAGIAMQASVPVGQFAGTDAPGLLARIREMLAICSRATAAAHHYETLKAMSDQELAARGHRRAELPRAAFERLVRAS